MPIKTIEADIDVVTAARIRIRNIFGNGVKVYLSFSGGKDSLCLAHLVLTMIQAGEISSEKLEVVFIDEEGIFPCVERTVLEWRKKFLLVGAKFTWFAIECQHFNCFNELTNDESFICWDSTKSDVWIRQPPPFAVMHHPKMKDREMTYQTFITLYTNDGIGITGIRTAESLQRLQYMAISMASRSNSLTNRNDAFPIYDWTDNDVWLYIRNENIAIPEAYMYLWQAGEQKRRLRLSQFFSIDTAGILVKMNEFYPDLMERATRREPNAYLAALYWDSEMFRRRTQRRKKLEQAEQKEDTFDYQSALMKLFADVDGKFKTSHQRFIAQQYRHEFIMLSSLTDDMPRLCRSMYESLSAGDPKRRALRGIRQHEIEELAKLSKRDNGILPNTFGRREP